MMKIICRMSTQILKKSDDMILFTHDSPLRLGQALQFGNSIGVVMSIFERNQLALLLKQSDLLEPIKILKSIQAKPQEQICTIDNIQESETQSEERKILPKRIVPQNQILTGNVYVDLFHPITYGQMLVIKDQSILNKLNGFDQVIYYSRKQLSNGIWFKSSENQGANCLLPYYALQYAQQIAKQNKTLLIVDQIYEHMIANQKLQETIQSYLYQQTTKTVYLSNLLKSLSDSCGYRPGHSNLTVAVIQKDSKDDLLNDELDKEIESLQSHIPSSTISKPSPFNLQIQSPLYYYLAEELYHVLSQYNQKKTEYIQKVELKIHIEPWDYYQYFDCKPIVEMIKLFNQQERKEHELVILVSFCIQAFHDELICQLKGNAQQIMNDVLNFSLSIKEFEEKTFAQFYYEKQKELEGKEFKNLMVQHLGRLYELYQLHLRMTDQLLQYKKDYV